MRETINDECNKDKDLITISMVIHAGRYNLSGIQNGNELSYLTRRTQDEVKSSIKLDKRIETKLNNGK